MKSSDSTVAQAIDSSFRDPSGFVFKKNDEVFRQINDVYKDHYDYLLHSGLYEKLTSLGLLIPWTEIEFNRDQYPAAYKVIKPRQIPFISYPYEWCFSQLKDAALVTLEIQRIALEHGMSLKDSSAYNIQFLKGKPVFIDSLSFEKWRPGKPWVAYRQFCQHFLAPLALMSYKNVNLNQLLRIFLDGISLELASSLLPLRSCTRMGVFFHIHLHALSQKHHVSTNVERKYLEGKFSLQSFYGLIENLSNTIKKLKWNSEGTEWINYYGDLSNREYIEHKKDLVSNYIEIVKPSSVWDLGANTGLYSRLASDKGISTISLDLDPACVEWSYLESKNKKEINILPLLLDVINPSPPMGWGNQERDSFIDRGPVDMVFALALIHHLAISNNIPFNKIAEFFLKICNFLIIEFIPKSDPNVQKLLRLREDVFSSYTKENLEIEFGKFFKIMIHSEIKNSERTIYLFERLK